MTGKISIGKAAEATGPSLKAIRYYEDEGLLIPRPRTEGGFRRYEGADVKRLLFIRRAKEPGIPLRQISDLLHCWSGSSCSVTRPALKKALKDRLEELEAQIALLGELRNELTHELSELDKRPLSDHGQGYCSCLGDVPRLIHVEQAGDGKD